MKAVILAAGIGSRLGKLTKDKPKCMLPILGNMKLIDYQIESLKKIGIKERNIFVIGGYRLEILKEHLKKRSINIVFNPRFKEWNNIYTFFLINRIPNIKDSDDFILLNSDTFFHQDILRYLLSCHNSNCVAIDTYKKLGDEEMKVLVKEKRIIKFGKDIPPSIAFGEYIGLAKFKKGHLIPLFSIINKLIKQGKTNLWYEIAFNYVLDKLNLGFIDTKQKPWIEIDTVEDYYSAKLLDIKL